MTTSLDYRSARAPARAIIGRQENFLVPLGILCLWALIGITLTGLAFILGVGPDVIQALHAAG
jgi:hypothetical protein